MLKNIATVIISLGCALAGFELFLAFTPYANGVSPMVYDAQLGMWHKRNYRGRATGACFDNTYEFDAAGRPIAIRTYAPHKADVVLLGDSYIEAVMVPPADILHNALADELDGRYNVLNYGLAGSSPVQQFVILHDRVDLTNTRLVIQFLDLETDLLEVIAAVASPVARPRVYADFTAEGHYEIHYPRSPRWHDLTLDILGNFQIYYFVKKVAYAVLQLLPHASRQTTAVPSADGTAVATDTSRQPRQAWYQLEQALAHSKNLITRRSPDTDYRLVIQSDNERNRDKLANFLDMQGIDYVLLDELTRRYRLTLPTLPCDFHWNAEAHRRLARALVQEQWFEPAH